MNSKKNSCRGNYMRKYGIGLFKLESFEKSFLLPFLIIPEG
jgi:hypothetical protein